MKELRDDRLFRQPDESYLGECPICFLPLPLDAHTLMPCCSKHICDGCVFANIMSNMTDKVKAESCMLCREPTWAKDDHWKREEKRAEANDPVAMRRMGGKRFDEGDYDSAFEYYTKAAELGDMEAHGSLAQMNHMGRCGEKDEKKAVYHNEEAAIGGHPDARYNLASIE
jgi:TPR repeat protein